MSLIVVGALLLVVAGCGGGGPKPTVTVTGGALNVTAKDTAFDVGTINAPAGTAFTVHFTNAESAAHNFAVYAQPPADALAKSDIITGPSATADVQVAALQPGTYRFRCDVHPDQMNGTIVVGGASGGPS